MHDRVHLQAARLGDWTDNGVGEMKWPDDFTKLERTLIRAIAKVALEAASDKRLLK